MVPVVLTHPAWGVLVAQIDKVDPTFLHQFGLLLAGLRAGGLAATGIYANLVKRSRSRCNTLRRL